VLEFRDRAFIEYFSRAAYLDLVRSRFGERARQHVQQMIQAGRLKRRLLEPMPAAVQ
jgi:hypothetical protein